MLGKLLVLAAVVLFALLGWSRVRALLRKARALGREGVVDLERDPDSGVYRKPED